MPQKLMPTTSKPVLISHEQCTRKPKSISSTLLEVLAQRPKSASERGTFGVIRHRQFTLSCASCKMKFVPNYYNDIPGL